MHPRIRTAKRNSADLHRPGGLRCPWRTHFDEVQQFLLQGLVLDGHLGTSHVSASVCDIHLPLVWQCFEPPSCSLAEAGTVLVPQRFCPSPKSQSCHWQRSARVRLAWAQLSRLGCLGHVPAWCCCFPSCTFTSRCTWLRTPSWDRFSK